MEVKEAKHINSIRLRTFLDLLTADYGDAAMEKFVEQLSPEARDIYHKLDDHAWLAPTREIEIIRGLAGEFKAWEKLNAAGRECIIGLLSNILSTMPGHKTVRNYIAWLPSFVAFFNLGLYLEVEEAKDGRTCMVRFSSHDKSPGSAVDVIFIQGLLEGLLNYIKVAFTEVRLRTVNTTIEDWPLKGTPAWVAFNQSTCIMEVKVGDLDLLITEVSRRSPRLDWSTSPRDAFMRQVISRASQLHHDKRELSTAVEYLHVANEELDKRLAENKKQRRMAANIQKGFIPAGIPDWEGLQFWVHFQPMEEVSGDLYDYFINNDGRLAYLVCDVSGHGVPAALISAIAKISFQNHRQTAARPADVFSNVNLDILNHVKMEGYLTAFYMIVDTDFKMTYSVAGMPLPILYRARTGEVEKLQGTGTLLGMFPDAGKFLSNYEQQLEPGDKLFIFTDGLPEGQNPAEEQFGEQRIQEAILETRTMDLEASCQHVMSRYRDFVLGTEVHDDLTLVGMMVSAHKSEFHDMLTEAKNFYAQGSLHAAIDKLREAMLIFAREPDALYLLGKYLALDKQYEEAIKILSQFKTLKPYDHKAYIIRAYCLYYLGSFHQAERELKMSLSLRNNNPSALYNLVKVYKKLGKPDEARDTLGQLDNLDSPDERFRDLTI